MNIYVESLGRDDLRIFLLFSEIRRMVGGLSIFFFMLLCIDKNLTGGACCGSSSFICGAV